MQTYLFLGRYTAAGRNGLLKEGGTAREKVTHHLMEEMAKGKIRHYAFCEGSWDFIVLVDLPDDKTKDAIIIAVTSGGTLETQALKLITPEQMDEIAALGRSLSYRPAGQ